MSFLLFIGGAAVLLLALNALYMATPHYKNQVFGVQKMLGGVPRDLDVLSTGSNHAMYAVDWSLTPARGFSVATGPQSLRWDARLYHKYRENIKLDGTMLIVLSNLILGFLEYPNIKSDARYYAFCEPREMPRYSRWEHIVNRYLPVLGSWKNALHILYHRGTPQAEVVAHEATDADAERGSLSLIAGWIEQFGLTDALNSAESAAHLAPTIAAATDVLAEMVGDARARGLRVAFMVPPFSAVMNSHIAPEFLDCVLYAPVRERFPDVPLLDYVHDPRFADSSLYWNGNMMNERGRRAFMPVLYAELTAALGGEL